MTAFVCTRCGQRSEQGDEAARLSGVCPRCTVAKKGSGTVTPFLDAETAVAPPDRSSATNGPHRVQPDGGLVATDPITGIGDANPELRTILQPPQFPDEIGRLGPYRVLRVLGSGGMGLVLQAEDPQLKRSVALKVMKPAMAAERQARERFRREAQAMALIEHDHVVSIYQVDEENDFPYFAMPLLRGETLQSRLDREGRLPVADVLRIARQSAEGLAAAHEHGMIHRDVKPSNLWLEAGTDRVKILDFGLARPTEEDCHLSRPGQVCGTPSYMSPEQALGMPVDPRSDLFSLGCVLYRMSTGQVPFQGKTALAVQKAIELQNPISPADLNRAVPAPLAALILRLLAKNPQARGASAREVADRLQEIEMSLDSPTPISRKPTRRHWFWVAGLGAASLALAIYLLLPGDGKSKEKGKPGGDETPKLRLLVPAYFFPGGPGLLHWDKLIAAADTVPITAIVNPASGPGNASDPNYVKIVERARKAGITVIGYVSTGYGKKPLATVKADMDRWLQMYPDIQGYFLDEQASGADKVDYYLELKQYAGQKLAHPVVINNPGVVCAEEYLARGAADVVCVTETGKGMGVKLPPWTERLGHQHFAALLYKIKDADMMRQALADVVQQRMGYVYITDADVPNPWERLPSWWDEELTAIKQANAAKPK